MASSTALAVVPGPDSPARHAATVEGTLGSWGIAVAMIDSTARAPSRYSAVRIRASHRQPISAESRTNPAGPLGRDGPVRTGGFIRGGGEDSVTARCSLVGSGAAARGVGAASGQVRCGSDGRFEPLDEGAKEEHEPVPQTGRD